ncbi:MAG TPA: ABC transporter permease [Steroidobacteraceae bacterium]|nr:ABC transporter permease [Steroidobacteraceae bacterium]
MSAVRQFLGVLGLNLAGIGERPGAALTIVVGVTCAVGVLVSMLAMGTGARRQELGGVREDLVVLTGSGAGGTQSSVPKSEAATVRDLPGIKQDSKGEPAVDFQTMIPFEARRRVTGRRIFFPLIGTTGDLTDATSDIHFTAGRTFRRGLHELVASNPCVRQFTGFELGQRRPVHGADWTVVGHFDQGTGQQCVVFADAETLMSSFGRNSYSQATVALASPERYDTLRAAVQADPSLHLEVRHQREVVQERFKPLNSLLDFVSYFVGTIMAIGATLGAVNSLYAIVDARRRELATLRAMGFGAVPIAASVLCESVLLALPGALLGGLLAWVLFNGLAASPFGYTFNLAVTPALAALGILWAVIMGLAGGVLPALRAGRVSVTTALRAT